jgi:hypothetical protein
LIIDELSLVCSDASGEVFGRVHDELMGVDAVFLNALKLRKKILNSLFLPQRSAGQGAWQAKLRAVPPMKRRAVLITSK